MVQSRIKNAFCPQAGLWILDTADPEVNDYNNCDKELTTYRKNTLSEHVCVCVCVCVYVMQKGKRQGDT